VALQATPTCRKTALPAPRRQVPVLIPDRRPKPAQGWRSACPYPRPQGIRAAGSDPWSSASGGLYLRGGTTLRPTSSRITWKRYTTPSGVLILREREIAWLAACSPRRSRWNGNRVFLRMVYAYRCCGAKSNVFMCKNLEAHRYFDWSSTSP